MCSRPWPVRANSRARGYTVHWLGTPRGIENELVPSAGLPLHLINVTGLRGKGKLSLLKAPFVLLKAVWQARKVIRELQPVCVLGFGGYVTGPGGVAARTRGRAGDRARAERRGRHRQPLAGAAGGAGVRSLPRIPSRHRTSCRTTGNPVRTELFMDIARQPLAGRKAHLLILGGSLGAEPLNKLLPEALAQLPVEVRPEVFHQAGKNHDEVTADALSRGRCRG